MTAEKPVCWGRKHRFDVERLTSGTIAAAEYLDDEAIAFRRCVAPTPTEWKEWLSHAWQAGQHYEVCLRDEEAGEPADCLVCTGDCQCSDVVKTARARFAVDGEGAVTRKPVVTVTHTTVPRPVTARHLAVQPPETGL